MEEYIDLVEKFLRGQMSLSEEASFKASLDSDKNPSLICFYRGIYDEETKIVVKVWLFQI